MRFRAPEQANEKAGEMTEDLRAALRKNLTPASAALIVIDVQNDFCAKGGYFDRTGADLSLVEPAVTRMLGLIDAARAAGVMVTFVRSHYDPVYLSEAHAAAASAGTSRCAGRAPGASSSIGSRRSPAKPSSSSTATMRSTRPTSSWCCAPTRSRA
jgi:hypothetical protein